MTLGKIAIAFTIMLAFSVSFSSTKEILPQPTTKQIRSSRLGSSTEYTVYKSIPDGDSKCELHMKVYISPGKTHHPLMALHGGGWYSGWYADSTEHLVSYEYLKRFLKVGDSTNTSYLIAVPEYRLVPNEEQPATQSNVQIPCKNASWEEVTKDVEDALETVYQSTAYNPNKEKIALFGFSAGAHLATWLAFKKTDKVSGVVILGAPVNFADMNAYYTASSKIKSCSSEEEKYNPFKDLLDRFIPLEKTDAISQNSFPARAISTPGLPPFFAVHGMRDTVVPFQQSLDFCLALSGDSEWKTHIDNLFPDKTELTSEDLTQLVTQQYPEDLTPAEQAARTIQQAALNDIAKNLNIKCTPTRCMGGCGNGGKYHLLLYGNHNDTEFECPPEDNECCTQESCKSRNKSFDELRMWLDNLYSTNTGAN